MSQVVKQPTYRLHKARNSAVVTLNGKKHYLGPWQSPESHEKYARLIAAWRRNNGVLPTPVCSPTGVLTVNELVLTYFRYAQGRYVKYGEATSEVACTCSPAPPTSTGSTRRVKTPPARCAGARPAAAVRRPAGGVAQRRGAGVAERKLNGAERKPTHSEQVYTHSRSGRISET